MDVTGRVGSADRRIGRALLETEILRPEMAFLAENPEAFGLVPDACPLATNHLLIAANGYSAEGGVSSPVFELEHKGIDGLFALYGNLLPHTDEVADALQAAFSVNKNLQEHPVSRYCAVLAEVTALQVLRGAANGASYEQTRVLLDDAVCRNLKVMRESFRDDDMLPRWEDHFFSVSMGICRIQEAGNGDYIADMFSAGNFHLYLLDESGMAPLWCTATPVFTPDADDVLTGKSIRFHHPEPFALLLVSESICAYNAAEQRSLRGNPGLVWRFHMRLEDYFLRLITDCVREYEFGDRAARFFVGRSHGRDSASGAMTVLRDGVSYEVFRLHCQTRLSVLGELTELLPNGYDPHNVPEQEPLSQTELAYIRRLLERDAELADRLTNALRLCALDKLEQGKPTETVALPADVSDYTRLEWDEISRTYRRFDCENDEDRARIADNTRMLRECLSEHWITLRPVLTEPNHGILREALGHTAACERAYRSCLDMNSRLAEMLAFRQSTVSRLGSLLADSLEILDAEGNDWVCGRAGADSTDVWAAPLTDSLPALLSYIQTDWREDTERYRRLLAAYTAEREDLFRRDIHPEWGVFAADWQAIANGCLPETRWDMLRSRLEDHPETVSFVELFDSLHRISRGTGTLRSRIRSRAAENRMARELSDRPDLRIAALRGAAYEDPDWGDGVIAVMDTATRNDFRATIRRWYETKELIERQKKAYSTYNAMYHMFL